MIPVGSSGEDDESSRCGNLPACGKTRRIPARRIGSLAHQYCRIEQRRGKNERSLAIDFVIFLEYAAVIEALDRLTTTQSKNG